ncbi:uncharacterized protein LOC109793246 [Cajanus cajan]|uniref:uncharacterized protein LOC109793246 n=1 Tax=Cajanus cajan TaxID=3821 RepID=UPI00098DC38E|nr:uncharacterized protein LOC109793246 [Cajanus cajan]
MLIKVFGCLANATTLHHNRKKFDPRGRRCVFLGFKPQTLHRPCLSLPFLSRPLAIPGSAAQENRIFNTTNVGSVNIRDGPYQGNKTRTNNSWNASFLSNFFNNDKGGSSSGIESSNARGTMNFLGLSKDKMASPLENVSSLLAPVHEHAHQLQLGVDKTSNTRLWNTSAGAPNMLGIGSSSNAFASIYPTSVISGPHPQPFNSIFSNNGNRPSGLSQSRPENFKSFMPSNNLAESMVHQPRPTDFINLSDLTLAPQSRAENLMSYMPRNNLTQSLPRPGGIINLSGMSVSRPRPKESMDNVSHMTNYLREQSLMYHQHQHQHQHQRQHQHQHQPRPEDPNDEVGNYLREMTRMYNLYHPETWPAESMSSLNPLRHSLLSQPKQEESVPSKNLPGSSVLPSLAAHFSNESDTSPDFKNSTCLMQTSQELMHQQAALNTPPATHGFPDMKMKQRED